MTDAATKKRLGQYFSGEKVANLLVDLCSLNGSEYVIDPMAGVGDMLVAAIQSGVPAENASGIEIDPEAGDRCKDRIPQGNVYIGDAFSQEVNTALGRTAWDLVITNPPYVRYQSMNSFVGEGIQLKSANEIRQGLIAIVNGLGHLGHEEKTCFQRIINNYSGLSDLAIPTWLLCAAMTRVGGRLAMVVPESWISRDYALSIKYMLLKFFNVEYIVEDWNSAWFSDALVKTNLLVAKRIRLRDNLIDVADSTFKHIRLGVALIGDTSLVEKLKANGQEGRKAFLSILRSGTDVSGDGFDIRHIRLSSFLSEIAASKAHRKLLMKLEPYTDLSKLVVVPKELLDVIGCDIPSTNLAEIEVWGFKVGQGLRTGANKFFYAVLSKSEGSIDYLVMDSIFGDRIIPVSQKYSLPAFRYQSDSQDGLVITKAMLPHRLLYIQGDFYAADGTLQNAADGRLAKHIADAEKMPIDSKGLTTRFPEFSAVKPNIRVGGGIENALRRHWFMLPALANRHTPQLCISRVNHKNARCCYIAEKGIVVDANFSTIWMAFGCQQRVFAIFALLNSSWTQSYLEAIATVMGGGALKVEASHIRKLLLPTPTNELITSLAHLGKRLAEGVPSEIRSIIFEIDCAVLRSLLGIQEIDKQRDDLRDYLQSKINARKR